MELGTTLAMLVNPRVLSCSQHALWLVLGVKNNTKNIKAVTMCADIGISVLCAFVKALHPVDQLLILKSN